MEKAMKLYKDQPLEVKKVNESEQKKLRRLRR
jgi:hypothetical protein